MHGTSKKQKLESIEKRIASSAEKSGRARSDVKLIAVSKLQSVEAVRELYSLGVSSFGENYLQESQAKQQNLKDLKIEWHFIGQIQSKKVKDIVGNFELIHSVDRLKIVERINSVAFEKDLCQKILVEVNLSQEPGKGGLSEAELTDFMRELQVYKNLKVCGLMLMPPLSEDPESLRPYFAQARKLLEDLRAQTFWDKSDKHLFKELSMGTSQDFHVAIEEGATMVRIGTVLFGPRPEQKDLQ